MTILPRAATAGELTKIRSDNQSSRLYLTVHIPAVVFQARLAALPASNDKVASITYNTGSGAYTDILADQTLYVGTSAGAYDLGMCRIRNLTGLGAVTGTFNIGLTSEIAWAANAYLTVVDEFALFPRWPYTDDNGAVFMDYDVAYANQHRYCASFPIFPRYAVKWLPVGGTVNVIRDGSQSWALNNTINGYAWAAPGSSAISGDTTNTVTITYNAVNATAGNRIALTVSNTDSVSFTGYGRAFILQSESDAITEFSVSNFTGSYSSGGWSAQIICYAQATPATIRDRALCIIHRRDWYGPTSSDAGSIGYVADDENIEMIGWIAGDSIQWMSEDKAGAVTFMVYGPQYWLNKITMPTVGLKNLSSHPTNWKRFFGLTAKSATWHVLMWRTTAPRCIDCFSIDNGYAALQLQSGGAKTVWEQLSNILNDFLLAKPCCDAYARLFMQIEQQCLDTTARSSIPTVMTLTTGDWENEIDFDWREVNEIAAVDITGEIYNGTNTSDAVYALSPGRVFSARGSSVFSRANLAVDSQTTLNSLAGAIYGWQNNPYPNWRFKLPSNLHLIDVAPYQYLNISVTAANTPRGIVLTNKRLIPREIRRVYQSGYLKTEVVTEAESTIYAGITGDTPADPPSPPAAPPPPIPVPPPPIPTVDQTLAGGIMLVNYAGTSYKIIYAGDISSLSQPTWTELTMPAGFTTPSNYIFDSQICVSADGSRLMLTGVKALKMTIWECTNWGSIKGNPTPPAPVWVEHVTYEVTTIGGTIIDKPGSGSGGQGAYGTGNVFYFTCRLGASWSIGAIALDGSLSKTSPTILANANSAGITYNAYNDISNIGLTSYVHSYAGASLYSWADSAFATSEISSPYANEIGGSPITAYIREAGATDYLSIRNSGGYYTVSASTGNYLVFGGNPRGQVIYAADSTSSNIIVSADHGATWGAYATWLFGKAMPINGVSDSGSLWVPYTTVTSGNVPARIYNAAGGVVQDLTGNWWTGVFSGAASTTVQCAKAWYRT